MYSKIFKTFLSLSLSLRLPLLLNTSISISFGAQNLKVISPDCMTEKEEKHTEKTLAISTFRDTQNQHTSSQKKDSLAPPEVPETKSLKNLLKQRKKVDLRTLTEIL